MEVVPQRDPPLGDVPAHPVVGRVLPDPTAPPLVGQGRVIGPPGEQHVPVPVMVVLPLVTAELAPVMGGPVPLDVRPVGIHDQVPVRGDPILGHRVQVPLKVARVLPVPALAGRLQPGQVQIVQVPGAPERLSLVRREPDLRVRELVELATPGLRHRPDVVNQVEPVMVQMIEPRVEVPLAAMLRNQLIDRDGKTAPL